MMKRILASVLAASLHSAITYSQLSKDSIPLDNLRLPEGYQIEVYAFGLENARQMSMAENGTLFVGSMKAGKVYAIAVDRTVYTVAEGLDSPAGVEYYNGDLYVAEITRVLKFENLLMQPGFNPTPKVVNGNFPEEHWQGWKFIRIGPDGKMYIPVGAPCNACMPDSIWHARILRMTLDGSLLEVYASGVRSTMGFDWDPVTQVLWFTDNGRDDLGDAQPPDELNKALTDSQHFGFPFVFGSKPDSAFWPQRPSGTAFINPAKELPPHCGAQGMRFYTGRMFEEKYRNGIFIAEHGFWGRTLKAGYRVSFVPVKNGRAMGYEVFCEGWLKDGYPWGRPTDVLVGPDGSLFISDDLAGCIYRIYR
jgi:glucose/arabinose dehydrogenase